MTDSQVADVISRLDELEKRVRAVEDTCRKSGLDRVTVEELERIRARMPTPKIFG